MIDVKVILFLLASWAYAIFAMEIYRLTFVGREFLTDFKSQLILSSLTIIVTSAVVVYILFYYPSIILENKRGGPYLVVGVSTGIIWNMIFSPIYETIMDFLNGNFK